METFLIVVAGIVTGILLLGAVGWLWLKRKLRGLGRALTELAAGLSGTPPFAITLERQPEADFGEPLEVDAVSRGFEAAGYLHLGDYTVCELDGVVLRALWHPTAHSFAVVYDHAPVGIYADVVRFFRDDSLLTVSSAPEDGMDHPDHARRLRLEVELSDPAGPQTLHDTLLAESGARQVIPARERDFERAFIGAWALEMDWQIARGGPSEAEIRRVAELGGQEPPDECAVALVQKGWRAAIAEYVGEEIRKAFVRDSAMSAQEWEWKRERIRVIHEHLDAEELVDELAWEVIAGRYDEEDDEAEDAAHSQARERLSTHITPGSIRQGFVTAEPLLPEKHRYERLGATTHPYAGDIYLAPQSCEDS